jgi:FkbM family methyltransferase
MMAQKLTGLKRLKKNIRRLQWSVLKMFSATAEVDCDQGKFTVYTADNAIGKHMYTFHGYEADWVERAVNFLESTGKIDKSKKTFIDVGGNIGVIIISILRRGLFQRGIAIEPTPRNLDLLKINLAKNNLTERTTVFPVAAGKSESTLELELDPTNYGDNRIRALNDSVTVAGLYEEDQRQTISVPVRRIDDLLDEAGIDMDDIGLFWIDVQGFEGYAYSGAERLLARGIPAVSEVWPYTIKRSGMTLTEFATIAQRFWTHVAIQDSNDFKIIPISELENFMINIGETDYSDVIFFRDPATIK